MEDTLTTDGKSLSQYRDGRHPYPLSLHPDIETSFELDENGVHEYQQHIGVLRWAIELGRIYIMTESIFCRSTCVLPGSTICKQYIRYITA